MECGKGEGLSLWDYVTIGETPSCWPPGCRDFPCWGDKLNFHAGKAHVARTCSQPLTAEIGLPACKRLDLSITQRQGSGFRQQPWWEVEGIFPVQPPMRTQSQGQLDCNLKRNYAEDPVKPHWPLTTEQATKRGCSSCWVCAALLALQN